MANKKLAVLSHFDIDNVIDGYVKFYLQELNDLRFDIIFVSTSPLSSTELATIEPLCLKTIVRQNIGYDFMSYKVGLLDSGIDHEGYESVLICNDSVYGPLFGLKGVIEAMNRQNFGFWGITQSKEGKSHIQSYFVYFTQPIVRSGALRSFFTRVGIEQSKWDIIEKYEIGLTEFLSREGFSYSSVASHPSLNEKYRLFRMRMSGVLFSKGTLPFPIAFFRFVIRYARNFGIFFGSIFIKGDVNPSHYYWRNNLREGVPFIKIELLRKNPYNLENSALIIQEIESVSDYPTRLIKAHLERTRCKY